MSRPPKMHQPLQGTFSDVLSAISDEHRPTETTYSARPFLKWAGGKRSILDELTKRLPPEYGTYYEPFLGGGSLFFSVKPERAYLSDINFHLIITFRAVKEDVEAVISQLKTHAAKHGKEYYLKARERLFKEKESAKIAALFIYLNKTCFNGLYRVNRAGRFNVPMGDYDNPPILDEDNLRKASTALAGATIAQHDFTQIRPARANFYYIDPPYHKTFSGYDGSGFGDEKHRELAEWCRKIEKADGLFMVSNSDTSYVRGLYAGFKIESVKASRSISCKGEGRGKERELIIRNY